jgi:hypothetical protein
VRLAGWLLGKRSVRVTVDLKHSTVSARDFPLDPAPLLHWASYHTYHTYIQNKEGPAGRISNFLLSSAYLARWYCYREAVHRVDRGAESTKTTFTTAITTKSTSPCSRFKTSGNEIWTRNLMKIDVPRWVCASQHLVTQIVTSCRNSVNGIC